MSSAVVGKKLPWGPTPYVLYCVVYGREPIVVLQLQFDIAILYDVRSGDRKLHRNMSGIVIVGHGMV